MFYFFVALYKTERFIYVMIDVIGVLIMNKMGIRQLKKELKDYKRNDLIELIVKMYKEDKSSQQYLDQLFLEEIKEDMLENCKEKVNKSFFQAVQDLTLIRLKTI